MENSSEFFNFKKIIIFWAEDLGKTSLTKILEKDSFEDEEFTDDNNIEIYIKYNSI